MKTTTLFHLCVFLLLGTAWQANAQVFNNVLAVGPAPEHDIAYFYVDTKIAYSDRPAPQIHITGYNYAHPNRAVKLTLSWYVWQNNFFFTQYRSDLGYYNPSRIRVGSYDDSGVQRIRLEIAIDNVYWCSYFFSATDVNSLPSDYGNWKYAWGAMPADTKNITVVKEYNYVGIGTNKPTSTLTVAGDVRAREVRVETTAGADFVFDEDYQLRPLSEVEKFIKENKHLPDIAPADRMVQNGISMGEMQLNLLQKVEELTLYVIELQKQNQKQQEEIEVLKQSK